MRSKSRKWFWVIVGMSAIAGLSLLGTIAFRSWQWLVDRMELDSAATSPLCIVVVTYCPGMSAAQIEKFITNRIERWVNATPGAMRVTSKSLPGISIIRVHFRDDIDPSHALSMTNQQAVATLPVLPPNTLPPIVIFRSSQPVGVLIVRSATISEEELRQTARGDIRHWLIGVEECVAPLTLGGKDRVLSIRLDSQKLEAHHLSSKDVIEALRKDAAYYYVIGVSEDEVNIVDPLFDKEMVEVVGVGKNAVVIEELGRVEDAPARQAELIRIDGRPAVGVPVYARSGASPKVVVEKISNRLASLEKRMPPQTDLQWVPLLERGKKGRADDRLLTINVRVSSDSCLSNTQKRVASIEQFIQRSIPGEEREAILSVIGTTLDEEEAQFSGINRPMDAAIFVRLNSQRRHPAAVYAEKLRHLLHTEASTDDLSIRFASRDMPDPVDIRIKGEKDEEAWHLAQEIRKRLGAIQGAVDVDIAQRRDAPFLFLCVDRKRVKQVSLKAADVIKQVAAALKPGRVQEQNIWIDETEASQVTARMPFCSDMNLQAALDTFAIGTEKERSIRLGQLATVKRITEAVEIDHIDLSRVLNVRANIEERDRREVIAEIRTMLEELNVPEGLRVDLAD